MPEELQHLIDRIQTEAVDKAEAQAAEIVSQAKSKAAGIVADAETQAAERLKKADQDAEAFTERSTKTLEQAGRDLLITVGQGVENILAGIVGETVGKALTLDVLQQMLVKMSEAYVAGGGTESRIDVLLSAEDQEQLVQLFRDQYRDRLAKGVELHADRDILKGFQVAFKDEQVYHDFSQEAIADALSDFLRPQLSEIIHRVARDGTAAAAEDADA